MFPDATASTPIIKHHHKIVKCMVHMVMGIETTDSWNVTPHSFVQGHDFIQQISTVTSAIMHMVMGIETTDSWNVTPHSFVQGHDFIRQISTVTSAIMPHMWAVKEDNKQADK
jgi:hypothetical protein